MRQIILPRLFSIYILTFFSGFVCYGQTQGQMNNSAEENFKKADLELNNIYQQILKEYKSDTVFVTNLQLSQRLWIQFRDAELKVKFPKTKLYGSVQPMCNSNYLEALTRERIKTLNVWLEGIEEGDVCSGSVKRKK
jgi:uncharacterized protein YecT (DUF1311 family)